MSQQSPDKQDIRPTYDELQAMYDAQCACADGWHAKYESEKEKKASATLLNRIAELKSQLAEVNQRLAAANAKADAIPSSTAFKLCDDCQQSSDCLHFARCFRALASSVPSAIERKPEIPAELFDGMAVFLEANSNAGPDHTLKSHHVSAVLDAVVRLIRKRQREQFDIEQSR